MAATDLLAKCIGFDWDEANTRKNWERHNVTPAEAEEVFFQDPLILRSDVKHSRREKRYFVLGRSAKARHLFVAFTIRRNLIRVISARDMNRREKEVYETHEEESA